jgi:exosortase
VTNQPPPETPRSNDRTPGAIPFSAIVAAVAVVVSLVWSFLPNWLSLYSTWRHDDNYSYGFLVTPISIWIGWNRRAKLDRSWIKPRFWALIPLVALLAIRYVLFERNEIWIETVLLLPIIVAIVALVGGLRLVLWAWPSLLFLAFMFPLPTRVNGILSTRLQGIATIASCWTLQLLGRPVISEGNVIYMGSETLEVARACNGLSMLLTFIALIVAVSLLIERPLWQRFILLLSSIPIALVSNIIRITVTALCYTIFGHAIVEKYAHDVAGWLMMPLALVFVWIELALMDWLVIEETPPEAVSNPILGVSMPGAKPKRLA